MSASGDDGVVEVGVDVSQMPISVIGKICLPRQEGAPVQIPGRCRVHARSALTTGLRGPNPKKQLWLITTQQGKKHSEPETGTLINPSPVGERKPWF